MAAAAIERRLACNVAKTLTVLTADPAVGMHDGGAEHAPRHFFTLAFTERKELHNATARFFKVAAVSVKFAYSAALTVSANHLGATLCDHQSGRVGVARSNGRHDRCVDYAKPGNSAHAQPRIDNG